MLCEGEAPDRPAEEEEGGAEAQTQSRPRHLELSFIEYFRKEAWEGIPKPQPEARSHVQISADNTNARRVVYTTSEETGEEVCSLGEAVPVEQAKGIQAEDAAAHINEKAAWQREEAASKLLSPAQLHCLLDLDLQA